MHFDEHLHLAANETLWIRTIQSASNCSFSGIQLTCTRVPAPEKGCAAVLCQRISFITQSARTKQDNFHPGKAPNTIAAHHQICRKHHMALKQTCRACSIVQPMRCRGPKAKLMQRALNWVWTKRSCTSFRIRAKTRSIDICSSCC